MIVDTDLLRMGAEFSQSAGAIAQRGADKLASSSLKAGVFGDFDAAQVEADETLLSSVITMSTNASVMQVRTQRALGVAENYLIDVEILSARASSNDAAVALTELMMTKVPMARQ
ncbi:MAG: DUF2563 family protein [Mycobacterium sp.]|nr:DUF2563 family protein [Mycobacterium sp.]